jgi:uncharacterized phage protein (TIGR02218 family)
MFNTQEISNQSGRPIALYTFWYGNTYWYYCTADEDKTVAGVTYLARAISDDGVTQGGSDQNDLRIVTQKDHPVASLFRNSRPSGKVWLTVRRWHIDDPDSETPLQWTGTVVNVREIDKASVEMSCRSLGGSFDRQGLRLAWGRMCPHVLYGVGCNNDDSNPKSAHAYPYEIDDVTGTNFTVVGYTAPVEGTFSGGFVEWTREDGSSEQLGIERQDGNDFAVLGSTIGLSTGQTVTLYPGCARDTATCKRFDNLPNYGGFPHLPGKSPFDGSPVF